LKKNSSAHGKTRGILLTVLLACVCVVGTELAASRHFAPALYQKVTTPVREAWYAVVDLSDRTAQSVSAFIEEQEAAWAERAAKRAAEKAAKAAAKAAAEAAALAESQLASEPDITDSAPITDPAVTEFKTVDGVEILTGGVVDIIYYNQGDDAWAEQLYGRDPIGKYGCGPTAMAMAVDSLTDQRLDPAEMAQFSVKQGYWAPSDGSYLSIVQGTAQAYGLQSESFTERTPEALCDALLSDKMLVALMGPGHFTKSGHFILLRGVTLDGEILVADPNSRERSLALWDPQLILDELSGNTASGGPLWTLSLPQSDTLTDEPE
jgi:hypothetical protein